MQARNTLIALTGALAAFGAGAQALLPGSATAPTVASRAQGSPGVRHQPVRFDADGAMIRPEGYHDWVYVGTPLTPNDMNGGAAPFPEFHNVYMEPGSFAEYRRTGEFPDGTVLIKELVGVGSKKATSGNGYFMGDFVGLEVAMKSVERFPDEPGHWAYFSFGHSYPLADDAKAQETATCNACHQTTANEDWVFSQYYPVLRAARPKSAR